jgi:hypothetical protein
MIELDAFMTVFDARFDDSLLVQTTKPSFATGAMDSWPKLINTGAVSKGLHYKGGVEDGKDSAKGGVIGGDFQWTAPAFSPIRCSPAK